MLDQLNRVNYLFDIYGKLLTERQQEVLYFYFNENYTLGEIADHYKVSRQAVHDLIRRALKSIEKFEEKLGLYAAYEAQNSLLMEADAILNFSRLEEEHQKSLKSIICKIKINNDL